MMVNEHYRRLRNALGGTGRSSWRFDEDRLLRCEVREVTSGAELLDRPCRLRTERSS